MNFRDAAVECQECGKSFIFTVEKQRKLADSGQATDAPSMCEACTQRIQYGGKLHGRIKWFSLEKGYGFIAGDGGGEVFVHRNSITLTDDGTLPDIQEGMEVLYEVTDSPKGPQAVQVTPVP
jgi:CspA family cold shock protein